MTPAERFQQFDAIYKSLPGSHSDRISAICNVLHCKPNTVRVWRVKTMGRVIPEAKLRILTDALII